MTMPAADPAHPTAFDDLQRELAEVARLITSAVEELRRPLRDLVEIRLDFLDRLTRAAITLTAAYTVPDSEAKRRRRITLAAAQEMLYLALRVHHQLIADPTAESRGEAAHSLLGSTILAGDYCFSRAAGFAAQTDNPNVVAIFAHSLQVISEGRLRQLFARSHDAIAESADASPDPPFDENAELIRSGAAAAAELAALAPAARQAVDDLVLEIVRAVASPHASLVEEALPAGALPPEQRLRWSALIAWINTASR